MEKNRGMEVADKLEDTLLNLYPGTQNVTVRVEDLEDLLEYVKVLEGWSR